MWVECDIIAVWSVDEIIDKLICKNMKIYIIQRLCRERSGRTQEAFLAYTFLATMELFLIQYFDIINLLWEINLAPPQKKTKTLALCLFPDGDTLEGNKNTQEAILKLAEWKFKCFQGHILHKLEYQMKHSEMFSKFQETQWKSHLLPRSRWTR